MFLICLSLCVHAYMQGGPTKPGHRLVITVLSKLNRFTNFFTGRFLSKFAVKCTLKCHRTLQNYGHESVALFFGPPCMWTHTYVLGACVLMHICVCTCEHAW